MNDEDLPAIAQKAIDNVLRYHDSDHTGLTVIHKNIINDRIAALLPLKSYAADPDVANLEIVADAAIAFLDTYNLEHPDKPLNEKWLYIGVQALSSIDLKPALVSVRVTRIPDAAPAAEPATDSPGVDLHETPQYDKIDDHISNDSQNSTPEHLAPATAAKRESSTQDEPTIVGDDELPPVGTPRAKKRRSNGPQVAKAKDPWGDEDITKLIKWKAQGMTHKEVGALLGRTEPACAIRHSIVLKQDKWIEFSRKYREKRAAGEGSDEEGEDEEGEIEVDEEGESARDDEDIGEVEEQKAADQIMEVTETNRGEDQDGRE